MSLCTNSAFGKVRKFPNFQSAKVAKKLKSKKLPSSFLGLNFLHLPNVLIHEPNEFIHVRKLKPTLKIQIHHFFSAEKISLCTECDKDKADYW